MEKETHPYQTESLETCIRHRHSIRFYKAAPVSKKLLHECLALAQLAPSNSNIQNWRITFAEGAAKDRIVKALTAAASESDPNVPPLPDSFKHFRSELGRGLYGDKGYGIPRSDKAAHAAAVKRNFSFFDAPNIAILSQHKDLHLVDSMCVGMFLQTFMLALTERGIGSCVQVSVTGYPEVLRREFGLEDEQVLLCGLAIGWPAEGNKVNELVVGREAVEVNAKFLE